MSKQLQFYQQVYSLYSLVNMTVKPTTPDLQVALKTLKGLYNQYDAVKDIAYKSIIKGIQDNWDKYKYILDTHLVNLVDVFSIITDNLKDNETAMMNLSKLQPLATVKLDQTTINKVKKIITNIGKLTGCI